MNGAKYRVPDKENRKEVSQEMFCQDCQQDMNSCEKDVTDCLKEAQLYKIFAQITNE